MIFMILNLNTDTLDIILEGLSIAGYIFILIMTFEAKKKNKIFEAKPFPLIVIAIGLGLCSATMDFLSEFFYINWYTIYKFLMVGLKISSLLLFAFGLLLLFRFTSFLMGEK